VSEVTRENLLFFLTLTNIVAGVVSITLATVAYVMWKDVRQFDNNRRNRRQEQPSQALVVWEQRPQALFRCDWPTEETKPLVRRSDLLGAQRRLVDDLYG
jgi:hypothetical protein